MKSRRAPTSQERRQPLASTSQNHFCLILSDVKSLNMNRQRAWLITFLIGLVLVFLVITPAAVVTSKKKHQADRSAYPLDVTLKAIRDASDTEVLVTITNNGQENIRLLARGSLLDPNPVLHKLNMLSQNGIYSERNV
jgi:hypothetical protein